MFDFEYEKKQLKKEVTNFIDDIEEDRIKAEDLYDDLSKEENTGEECVRLKEFLDAEPSYFKESEKLLDEVYDAETEKNIKELYIKFNNLRKDYSSVRENDLLDSDRFY